MNYSATKSTDVEVCDVPVLHDFSNIGINARDAEKCRAAFNTSLNKWLTNNN